MNYLCTGEEDVFCSRLQRLLEMSIFNDIMFNCKDGGVPANRLVLSVYSNFLANIFAKNPMITAHPVHNTPDSGINLPGACVKDVKNLIRVINAANALDFKIGNLKGLENVAKMLRIALVVKRSQSFVEVQAIPKHVGKLIEEGGSFENEQMCVKRNDKSDQVEGFNVNDKNIDFSEGVSESNTEFSDVETDCNNDAGRKVVCPTCNITCKTPTGLRVHIGLSHRSNDQYSPSAEKGKRVCKCGKMFAINSRRLFKEHKQRCAAYRKEAFICEICKAPFDEMPSLTIHLTSVHGINKERNSCVCGETFKTKHRVRKHSISCKIYRDAAVFCNICELPFLTNNHLQQHYRTSAHKEVQRSKRTLGRSKIKTSSLW